MWGSNCAKCRYMVIVSTVNLCGQSFVLSICFLIDLKYNFIQFICNIKDIIYLMFPVYHQASLIPSVQVCSKYVPLENAAIYLQIVPPYAVFFI